MVLSLAQVGYRELLGEDFVDYFLNHPEGTDGRYAWMSRRVDELRNLYLARV